MAMPSEKLATSLEVLQALQAAGRVAIRSKDLTRPHQERLVQNGFLQEVIKGGYVPSRPDEVPVRARPGMLLSGLLSWPIKLP